MKKTLRWLLINSFLPFLAFLAIENCQAQSEQEKLQEIEMQRQMMRQRALTVQLDSAILLAERGQHELADEKFRFVLKNLKSIPSDFTYHFGKNSFFLGKYKQSIDWLNKYIQLKGTSGQYSELAAGWLLQAEAELLKEREMQSKQAGEVLSRDYDIDCGAAGKVICPICSGTKVIVKKSYLRDTYSTCNFCDEHGTMSCVDYNKLLRGKLTPAQN